MKLLDFCAVSCIFGGLLAIGRSELRRNRQIQAIEDERTKRLNQHSPRFTWPKEKYFVPAQFGPRFSLN